MSTNTITVRDSFIVNALRHCGYNNYAAIADIIDNSVEPDVDATTVNITLATDTPNKGGVIREIIIRDNGCGMDFETMQEAMCLGSMTGKTGEANLGMYGAGMKTAALSIGKKLTVISKVEDQGCVSKASLDITEAVLGGPIHLEIEKVGLAAYEADPDNRGLFGLDGHGTIVVIGSIDRLTNTDRKNFGGHLRTKLGETFGKFIDSNTCEFIVDGTKVTSVDLMVNALKQNEVLGYGDFTVDGKNFNYKAYFLPKDDSADTAGEGAVRNIRNQGLYIYRQNRLIGRGLTLGMWVRHPALNGLRVELFTNGTCDEILGTTFTKMVSEQSKEMMSQSFRDTLLNNIGPYINEVKARSLREAAESRAETDPAMLQMYENVTKEMNDNLLLKVNRRGENKPKVGPNEHITRGPQAHPPMFRERKNKWLDGIKEVSMGKNGDMYAFEHSNNRCIVLINVDHAFYTEFYKRLPMELKHQMAKVITCQEIAKLNVNYYGSEDIQAVVDQYNETISSEVSKSLTH